MNEDLQKELLEYLRISKDFILEQAPGVVQQALKYHYLSSLICSIFFTIIFLLCAGIAIYNLYNPKLNKYDNWEIQTFILTFVPSVICLISLLGVCSNIDTFIKVTTAPKYFLIRLFK